MNKKYKRLIKCVILDAIGMASYAIPVIDLIWAPVAAAISFRMFGERKGKYTAFFTFIEEILPATDIIPSFTIFWFLFDFLGLGKQKENAYNSSIQAVEVK